MPTTVITPSENPLPSSAPSQGLLPSFGPSLNPSSLPSAFPSSSPSRSPTSLTSSSPTVLPSLNPTMLPSLNPTILPSIGPMMLPSLDPTMLPSLDPTTQPMTEPSSRPSSRPSGSPSSTPTAAPSPTPTCTDIEEFFEGEYEEEEGANDESYMLRVACGGDTDVVVIIVKDSAGGACNFQCIGSLSEEDVEGICAREDVDDFLVELTLEDDFEDSFVYIGYLDGDAPEVGYCDEVDLVILIPPSPTLAP